MKKKRRAAEELRDKLTEHIEPPKKVTPNKTVAPKEASKKTAGAKAENGPLVLQEKYQSSSIVNAAKKIADSWSDLKNFGKEFYIYLHNSNLEREYKDEEPQNSRFDSLSRLLALDSQCAAACFVHGKILIAFNEVHARAKEEIKDKFEKHAKIVFQYFKQPPKSQSRTKLLLRCCVHLGGDEKTLKKQIGLLEEEIERDNDEEVGILILAEPYTTIYRLRTDILKIESALAEQENIVSPFDNNIKRAFSEGNFEIVVDGKPYDKCQAEMRIVDWLKKADKKPQELYIGLSKLCCAHCHVVIREKGIALQFKGQELKIKTRGHHGEFEWHVIQGIQANEVLLKSFLGCEGQKESASYKAYRELRQRDKKLALNVIVQHIGYLTKAQAKSTFGVPDIELKWRKTYKSQMYDVLKIRMNKLLEELGKLEFKERPEIIREEINKLDESQKSKFFSHYVKQLENEIVQKANESDDSELANLGLSAHLKSLSEMMKSVKDKVEAEAEDEQVQAQARIEEAASRIELLQCIIQISKAEYKEKEKKDKKVATANTHPVKRKTNTSDKRKTSKSLSGSQNKKLKIQNESQIFFKVKDEGW
eukprot:TRINITY_DN2284_c0_g3_i1.p1 TRINITY_DN2284_c0_g3~~TRINITY_DN2284_c0_g3_i1.p1  ORF type:complete len:592 (+),score=40.31 TRINITY_DN2284_c0_g3_i1:94-1869(+)